MTEMLCSETEEAEDLAQRHHACPLHPEHLRFNNRAAFLELVMIRVDLFMISLKRTRWIFRSSRPEDRRWEGVLRR